MLPNSPALWQTLLPTPAADGHKYSRGHCVILGGTRMTGAARLASEAAMRIGAGLCTIITAPATTMVYLTGAPHIMVEDYKSLGTFADTLADKRRRAVLMGCGAGREDDAALQQAITTTLQLKRTTVLDGDALTVFEDSPARLMASLHTGCVLTPHESEFTRLFPKLEGDRVSRAKQAAVQSHAVIVLKGAETVIASPDGRIAINSHATPWLATAGSGDVLAGIILGLLTQGMSPFEAACAGVWIHGDAGKHIEAGLVAPDLICVLPVILKHLLDKG